MTDPLSTTDQTTSSDPVIYARKAARTFMTAFWFILTAALACFVWSMSRRPIETPEDIKGMCAFFGSFWLLVTALIFRLTSMKIRISGDTITASSAFRRERKLSLNEIASACVKIANNGAFVLHIIPVDHKNKKISFPMGLFSQDDLNRIKEFIKEKLDKNDLDRWPILLKNFK